MKFFREAHITGEAVDVVGGSAEFKRIVNERSIKANIVYISPGVEVYGDDHKHDDHEMLYMISGDGTIYNGNHATAIKSGDSVIFEPNEPHRYTFGNAGAKIIELKWT